MFREYMKSREVKRTLNAIQDDEVRFWTFYFLHLESALLEAGYEPFCIPTIVSPNEYFAFSNRADRAA